MKLTRAPKHAGHGPHRTRPAEETWRALEPLIGAAGITRVADITGLDRVGIPVYSAVVPDSDDVLSVYNGKGVTQLDAKVGAVMEAVERQSALAPPPGGVIATARVWDSSASCGGGYAAAAKLAPEELVLPLHPELSSETQHALVAGVDLLTDAPILVPAQAVTITFLPEYGKPCYTLGTSNGLAAGNTLEEAICHAVCELVERDAWTLADLRARHLPAQLQVRDRWPGPRGDDLVAFPDVDLRSAPAEVAALAEKYADAGVQLRLKDITSDLGIATVMATTFEAGGAEHAMAHVGLGTHPDAIVAMTRALTEVAQCRVVDVQATREDLASADADDHPFAPHTRRLPRVRSSSWYHTDSPVKRSWSQLPHTSHRDVLDDIEVMLDSMARRGLDRVIAIDLTRPELGIPVVRVLAPGLESWSADGGRLGKRAEAFWRDAQLQLRAETVA